MKHSKYRNTGLLFELLTRQITADILEIQVSYLSMLEVIVREPLTILFTIIVMFTISPELTLFIILFIWTFEPYMRTVLPLKSILKLLSPIVKR